MTFTQTFTRDIYIRSEFFSWNTFSDRSSFPRFSDGERKRDIKLKDHVLFILYSSPIRYMRDALSREFSFIGRRILFSRLKLLRFTIFASLRVRLPLALNYVFLFLLSTLSSLSSPSCRDAAYHRKLSYSNRSAGQYRFPDCDKNSPLRSMSGKYFLYRLLQKIPSMLSLVDPAPLLSSLSLSLSPFPSAFSFNTVVSFYSQILASLHLARLRAPLKFRFSDINRCSYFYSTHYIGNHVYPSRSLYQLTVRISHNR